MPAWPGTLPTKPLMRGYQESHDDPKLRSPMDAGPAKVRRRFTATVFKFNAGFILTDTELTIFEDFYADDLKHGSLSFTWVHPRTGAAITSRIKGVYAYTTLSDDAYEVRFEVEILP